MLTIAIGIAFALMTIALLLNLHRLLAGPDLPDRILALVTAYINTIALLMLFGIYRQSDLFFEAALLIAVTGFVSTIAVAKYLLRGDIIE